MVAVDTEIHVTHGSQGWPEASPSPSLSFWPEFGKSEEHPHGAAVESTVVVTSRAYRKIKCAIVIQIVETAD